MNCSTALRLVFSPLLLALAGGCAVVHPAVSVVGDAGATSALVGAWEGSYRSADTGRSGSIYFELVAEADSSGGEAAFGEVVMSYFDEGASFYPADPDRWPHAQGPRMKSDVLTLRFVRVGDGRVSGSLDPYTDPACGCLLYTTFEGAMSDGVIEGIFTARGPEHSHLQQGTWSVRRQPETP